jgi:multisubunit Na+/H+ antiporter MnhE subunit
MNLPSLIFGLVIILPLLAFVIWLLLQDKRKGLAAAAFLASFIVYTIVRDLLK